MAQQYARLLLSQCNGYPLWFPEPIAPGPSKFSNTSYSDGIRIGDVGFISHAGLFEPLLNVRAPRDDHANEEGVLEQFGRLDISPADITYTQNVYPKDSTLVDPLACVHVASLVGRSAKSKPGSAEYIWSSLEGAILHLPNGATRVDARLDPFRAYAIKHASQWHEWDSRVTPDNGTFYLVTGYDKTDAWGLGTFRRQNRNSEPVFQVATYQRDGSDTSCFAQPDGKFWTRIRFIPRGSCVDIKRDKSPKAPTEPGTRFPSQTLRDDAVSSRDSPEGLHHTIFIRGFSVTVEKKSTGKRSIRRSLRPLIGRPFLILVKRKHFAGDKEDQSSRPKSEQRDFHPSIIINRFLLDLFPDAEIAITHDDEWGSVIRKGQKLPSDYQLVSRILKKYIPRFDRQYATAFLELKIPLSA